MLEMMLGVALAFMLVVVFSVIGLLAMGMIFVPIVIVLLLPIAIFFFICELFFGRKLAIAAAVTFIAVFLFCGSVSCRVNCTTLCGVNECHQLDEPQTVTVAPKAPDEFDFWFSRGRIINVSEDNDFETNIREAHLSWCDDAINEEKFPFTKSDSGTKEAFVMGRDGIITYDFAMNEISNRGLRPATVQEALAFIRMYPQSPGTEMLVMGQSWLGRGGIWYARYRVSGNGSSFDAFNFDPRLPWFDVCFLAVRY
jgi:hypothetical protein